LKVTQVGAQRSAQRGELVTQTCAEDEEHCTTCHRNLRP